MFGIEIADASFVAAALIAAVAGILSFLSPCVLPIVPPYLAYMTGVKVSTLRVGERSAVLPALFFMLGLSTVFLIMGYAASAFGRAFLQYQPILVTLSGIFVIVLGLHFLHVFRIPLLTARRGWQPANRAVPRSAPMCWDLPSPSAGRPASGRSCR